IGLGVVGMALAAKEMPAGAAGELFAATPSALRRVPAPPERFTFVDLQTLANHKLKEPLGSGREGNDLASLRTGERTCLGINFKIGERFIQLGSKYVKEPRPNKVEGIKVGKTFAKLHILHSTGYGRGDADDDNQPDSPTFIRDGTTIAEYIVRYEDGKTETIQ